MSNRVVIVTGGSAGIGFATAKKFLTEGDKVVILSTNEKKGLNAQERLSEFGEVTWIQCHVDNVDECKAAVDATYEKYGRVDILVNNAGIVSKRDSFLEVDLEDVKKTLAVDVMGTLNMMHAVTKYMVEQEKGVIVNISSICGSLANSESVGYHASKGAVQMITKSLGRELSGFGIRVVAAAPGWVRTEMIDDTVAAIGASLHMKGRIIEPAEIAGVVYLLTLDEASAINGSIVMADDGYSSFKGIDGGMRSNR